MKLKYLPFVVLVFLLLGQLVRIDKTNPPVESDEDFVTVEKTSAELSARLQNACYDCHSHETEYPWYADVAPISWWVKRHINVGRKHLNFSIWGRLSTEKRKHKMEEAIAYTQKKWMPLGSYTWMHPEAKLDDHQRAELVAYFESIMAKY